MLERPLLTWSFVMISFRLAPAHTRRGVLQDCVATVVHSGFARSSLQAIMSGTFAICHADVGLLDLAALACAVLPRQVAYINICPWLRSRAWLAVRLHTGHGFWECEFRAVRERPTNHSTNYTLHRTLFCASTSIVCLDA
jgi:hypothetical protein